MAIKYYCRLGGCSECTKCPLGHYQNEKGQDECIECDTGMCSVYVLINILHV